MTTAVKSDLDRILRAPEVLKITGQSLPTIWRKEQADEFPKRVKIGANAVGWLESEIRAWMDQLAANRDSDQAA